ncbi:tautomerase family protein [Agathobaculum sp. NTUH-O15-33]|uniref:tautomerase family protein n=1 Tax=Agathobaculum sp. NTUH-O15-33 TaxID=3079302 RepID=UPI0029587BBE|nr:tautomerase family protein [Agathobaculum sp. NTUH-O15-33]WNX85826.1 tautomerase family protein [Agathobaculum sp. NTUH-O15-33]
MPHIDITMFPGRDHDTKAALAQKVQRFIAQDLGIEERVVSVSIRDIPKDKWAEHMAAFEEDTQFIKPKA